jgi:hypothetical protein
MRLGVLEFGSLSSIEEAVLNPLRARDVDLVTGLIESLDDSLREAKRISRADCDGVLLMTGEDLDPVTVPAAATLLAGVPLLLAGHQGSRAFFDCVGALEAIGARFDRIYLINSEPRPAAYLEAWLQEHAKKERHRGLDAAYRLYGQRLCISPDTGGLDAPLWMHQFGIIATAEAEGSDFAAPTGDACGALTDHLLALVAGEPVRQPVELAATQEGHPEEGDIAATFARITRLRGRFRCLLLRGALRADGTSPARVECSHKDLFAVASSPWLHTVPGEHLGAMRAACDALDIDTVVLRPA